MTKETEVEKLEKMVKEYDGAILYEPMGKEISYEEDSFPLTLPEEKLVLPDDLNSNPFEWADKCQEKFGEKKVCILIPGLHFHRDGTRHGRGGGWYDRFLSKVPSEWLRIGVLDEKQLSEEKIERKEWDEPMDWLLVQKGDTWQAFETKTRF